MVHLFIIIYTSQWRPICFTHEALQEPQTRKPQPKIPVLRNFTSLKIHRSQSDLNPLTLVIEVRRLLIIMRHTEGMCAFLNFYMNPFILMLLFSYQFNRRFRCNSSNPHFYNFIFLFALRANLISRFCNNNIQICLRIF